MNEFVPKLKRVLRDNGFTNKGHYPHLGNDCILYKRFACFAYFSVEPDAPLLACHNLDTDKSYVMSYADAEIDKAKDVLGI